MLIINADDWGRSVVETDAALKCYRERRITSVSAMVLMQDSKRAARLAKDYELDDVGLHLNFSEEFTDKSCSETLKEHHGRIIRFLKRGKYAQLLYNPFLRKAFAYCYYAQVEEFMRLFEKSPSHIDGHHHMHLCANVLFSSMIPGGTKLRRNFSFWPGEKSLLNRVYRGFVDRWLERKYHLPDYFFCLSQCLAEKKIDRMMALAESSNVELMTHPIIPAEFEYLTGAEFAGALERVKRGSYTEMTRNPIEEKKALMAVTSC